MFPPSGVALIEVGATESSLALELCEAYVAAARALQPGFMAEHFIVRLGLHRLNDVHEAYVVNRDLAPIFAPFMGSTAALPAAELLWKEDLPEAVQALFDLQSRLIDPSAVCDGLDLPEIHAKLEAGLPYIVYYGVVAEVVRSAVSVSRTHITVRFRTSCPLNERGGQKGWCAIKGKDYQAELSLYEVAQLLHQLQHEVTWRFTNAYHQKLQRNPGPTILAITEMLKQLPSAHMSLMSVGMHEVLLGDIIEIDNQIFVVIGKTADPHPIGRITYAVEGLTGSLTPMPELLDIYRAIFPG
ncbi:MAG TPA: hypothetical protein VNG90_02215 [Candidatus Acidoferrum sp.]|nr:hypothetical protein [Candidatus Acidoferrum sp.]